VSVAFAAWTLACGSRSALLTGEHAGASGASPMDSDGGADARVDSSSNGDADAASVDLDASVHDAGSPGSDAPGDFRSGGPAFWAHIAGGSAHTCAVLPDSGVECWGDNSTGQLGDGTVTPAPSTAKAIYSPARASRCRRSPGRRRLRRLRCRRRAWVADAALGLLTPRHP
jgi:hypothetical protein